MQRRLEQLRHHGRVHIRREAENGHPAVRHRHGVYLGRVVERVPVVGTPEIEVPEAFAAKPLRRLPRRDALRDEVLRRRAEIGQHGTLLPRWQVYPRREAEEQPLQLRAFSALHPLRYRPARRAAHPSRARWPRRCRLE